MMLLDSNLIIYAAKPEYAELRAFIGHESPSVSAVSRVEVLGYDQLTPEESQHFIAFFGEAEIFSISDAIVDRAILLRQLKKMKLGDALIAATALVHGKTLATHNTSDFAHIPGLSVFDPLVRT